MMATASSGSVLSSSRCLLVSSGLNQQRRIRAAHKTEDRVSEAEVSSANLNPPSFPLAPAAAAVTTPIAAKSGVSTRCNRHQKKVVQTRRYPRGGANAFNLPYRVRSPVHCSALDPLARRCTNARYAAHGYLSLPRTKKPPGGRHQTDPSCLRRNTKPRQRSLCKSQRRARVIFVSRLEQSHNPVPGIGGRKGCARDMAGGRPLHPESHSNIFRQRTLSELQYGIFYALFSERIRLISSRSSDESTSAREIELTTSSLRSSEFSIYFTTADKPGSRGFRPPSIREIENWRRLNFAASSA